MPEAVSRIKDPAKVRAGELGATSRWGPPGTRTVKIGDLTVEQRQLVLALVAAAKSIAPNEKAPAVTNSASAQEVSSASSTTPTS